MGAFFCADGRALCLDRGDDHGVRVHRMKSYTCGLDARMRTHARRSEGLQSVTCQ